MYNKAPSPRLFQQLGEIFKRLGIKQQWIANSETVSQEGSLVVCPEKYQENSVGYHYFAKKGWYTTNCTNAKTIHSVINILVHTVAY